MTSLASPEMLQIRRGNNCYWRIGGVFFVFFGNSFFFVLAPGGFYGFYGLYGPGSWWLLVAPGGSWWLLWLLRLLWILWLLAPMAHLSSIDQSISEACSPGACCALDTPWVSSIYLPTFLPSYLSIHLSIYRSIHLSIHPSISISTSTSISICV